MTTYKIIRFFQEEDNEVIIKGMTLEQAQEHCNDPETSSSTATSAEAEIITESYGAWFDGYTVDDEDDEEEEEVEYDGSKCPVCCDPIDYCQGHGQIGDPEGYAALKKWAKHEPYMAYLAATGKMFTEKHVEITQGHETLQLSAVISGIRISKRYSDYSTEEALQDFLDDLNHNERREHYAELFRN